MSNVSQDSTNVSSDSTKLTNDIAWTSQTALGGSMADNLSLQITMVKLDGTNYLPGHPAMCPIQSRGLYPYFTTIPRKRKDLTSCMINGSVKILLCVDFGILCKPIGSYMLLSTAQEIWLASSQAYSQIGNDAYVYELIKGVHEIKKKVS